MAKCQAQYFSLIHSISPRSCGHRNLTNADYRGSDCACLTFIIINIICRDVEESEASNVLLNRFYNIRCAAYVGC
jgi:hypothetical protein